MKDDGRSSRRVAVLADDLSGALTSAASLAEHFGEAVPVLDDVPDAVPARLVLNSRARAEGVRRDFVERVVRSSWQSGTRLFDRRVDSTLRGPVAEELMAMVESLPAVPWVVAVPAYPGAGRTTRGGHQWHGRTRLGRVADAVGAGELSRRLGGEPVETSLRHGEPLFRPDNPGPYVVDVRNRVELQRVALGVETLLVERDRPVVLASSGDLLRYVPSAPGQPVVVVWGSQSRESGRHLRHLVQMTRAVIVPVWDAPNPAVGGTVRVLVSEGDARTPGLGTDRAAARRALDHLAAWETHGYRPRRVVVSGGDTAQALLRASGADAVDALGNPAPLVGRGMVRGGGLHGLELITKGGKVGSPDLLVDLVELFWERPAPPPEGGAT